MSLFIASLNSGSNGNAYYIGNGSDAVLFDAGISCRELEKRLSRLSLDIQKIRGIFITHEHADHISGLKVLVSKHKIPVYASRGTALHFEADIDPVLMKFIEKDDVTEIAGFSVKGFRKKHDARDPFSFIVSFNNCTVGIFTDIGAPCKNVISHFQQCHAVFLESNYDEEMLEKGKYPEFLKKRISSDLGHLSNQQALEVFLKFRHPFMSHIILSHLSQENNCPDLVKATFQHHAGRTQVIIASRERETDLISVGTGKINSGKSNISGTEAVQTSLF